MITINPKGNIAKLLGEVTAYLSKSSPRGFSEGGGSEGGGAGGEGRVVKQLSGWGEHWGGDPREEGLLEVPVLGHVVANVDNECTFDGGAHRPGARGEVREQQGEDDGRTLHGAGEQAERGGGGVVALSVKLITICSSVSELLWLR